MPIGALSFALWAYGCAGQDAGDLMAEAPQKPTPAAAPLPTLTAPKPAEDAPVTRFVGSYKYVGGVLEQRVVWAKIEGIASSFNIFARGIVRGKLAESNQIAKEIRIEADSETLVIHFDQKPQSAPLDGSSVKHKAVNGEQMDMSFKLDANKLEQTFAGKGKGQVNTFEIDGDKLVLHVSIKASQLPRELAYDLTYQREPATEPLRSDE
jgi:hypothetical protein